MFYLFMRSILLITKSIRIFTYVIPRKKRMKYMHVFFGIFVNNQLLVITISLVRHIVAYALA